MRHEGPRQAGSARGRAPEAAEREASWSKWRALTVAGKLAYATSGLRRSLPAVRRRGVGAIVAAVLFAPIGALYALASVVRDSLVHRAGTQRARRPSESGAYLRHRFGGTQRFVHWREHVLALSLDRRTGRPSSVLDVPCGYGRFTPALTATSRLLVSADIDGPRLRALRAARPGPSAPSVVQADLQAALPFKAGVFGLVFHLRYLQHAHTHGERQRALAELTRVARRWIVVSYYRRGNLHALVHAFQAATRASYRRPPAMLDRRQFGRLVDEAGCRVVRDLAVLPGFHAQRLVLLEKRVAAAAPDPAYSRSARSWANASSRDESRRSQSVAPRSA